MNDRLVHPYRQPQDPEKPPGDPMRVVLVIAGVVAALIAAAAIFVGLSERFASKAEPVASVHRSFEGYVLPTIVDASTPAPPPTVAAPAPPKKFPEDPLSFVASAGACFGNCLEHTTLIEASGRVTLSMSRMRGPVCATKTSSVSRADLDALAKHARSIHMEAMPDSYVHMTDVQRLSTEVSGKDKDTLVVEHMREDDASPGAAIYGLYKHIEKVAGTEEWMKTCARR